MVRVWPVENGGMDRVDGMEVLVMMKTEREQLEEEAEGKG